MNWKMLTNPLKARHDKADNKPSLIQMNLSHKTKLVQEVNNGEILHFVKHMPTSIRCLRTQRLLMTKSHRLNCCWLVHPPLGSSRTSYTPCKWHQSLRKWLTQLFLLADIVLHGHDICQWHDDCSNVQNCGNLCRFISLYQSCGWFSMEGSPQNCKIECFSTNKLLFRVPRPSCKSFSVSLLFLQAQSSPNLLRTLLVRVCTTFCKGLFAVLIWIKDNKLDGLKTAKELLRRAITKVSQINAICLSMDMYHNLKHVII